MNRNRPRHLSAVPRRLMSIPEAGTPGYDELVNAGLAIILEAHTAARIIDGTLMYDPATERLVDSGKYPDSPAVAELDTARRAAIETANTVEAGGTHLLAVLVPTPEDRETTVSFGALIGGWRCTCTTWAVLEDRRDHHEGECCTHIATVSTLVLDNNPPPLLANLPADLLDQIREHRNRVGY